MQIVGLQDCKAVRPGAVAILTPDTQPNTTTSDRNITAEVPRTPVLERLCFSSASSFTTELPTA